MFWLGLTIHDQLGECGHIVALNAANLKGLNLKSNFMTNLQKGVMFGILTFAFWIASYFYSGIVKVVLLSLQLVCFALELYYFYFKKIKS